MVATWSMRVTVLFRISAFPSSLQDLKDYKYKTVMLTFVLYGCETWSLTLWEEHRLRVPENRVLRRIFGPKREEMVRGWRTLHNEELLLLGSSN